MSRATLNLAKARWRFWRTRAATGWSGLTRRERQLVTGAAWVLSGLVVWLLFIQPPLQKIAYWQAETPKLRTQKQTLETLLQQLPAPSAQVSGQGLEQALRASLETAGLEQFYRLQADTETGDSTWQLTFNQAPADGVMQWLLEQPQQFSLYVTEARLQRADGASAQASAGHLSGIVRMYQAPGASKEAL
ncbi:type II secretion system protein GspM [Pseudomonas viridiflava]|uniref:type II secretion system protein GspM n=1 Tax=Pseudomonas syringae group TaxID=136849 RepID=UPI000F03B493|nr:type II secretion system protein GspM [Pseudomonas viridiflava]